MDKNLSPEEKLLRLIRNKDKNIAASEPVSGRISGQSLALPSPAAKKNLQFSSPRPVKNLFSLKNLKIFLVSLIVILFGYVIFELLLSREQDIKKLKAQEKIDLKQEVKELPVKEMPAFDYYAGQINKRDIFKPAFNQGEGTQISAATEDVADLRLAGIIVDKQKPQAIIEDTKLKKTYFLYKGDSLGSMRVEDIQESKVILSYGTQIIELVP